MTTRSVFAAMLLFGFLSLGNNFHAQTVPLELDQTITLPATGGVWDVMPTWFGYSYWVQAVSHPADTSTMIYWGRTDIGLQDSISIPHAGTPQNIAGLFGKHYEPYFVLGSILPNFDPPYSGPGLRCRVYKLSDCTPDEHFWEWWYNWTGGMWDHTIQSNFSLAEAVLMGTPPEMTSNLSAIINYWNDRQYTIHNVGNFTEESPQGIIVSNMLEPDSCVTTQVAGGSIGSTLWNGQFFHAAQYTINGNATREADTKAYEVVDQRPTQVFERRVTYPLIQAANGVITIYDGQHLRLVIVESLPTSGLLAWTPGRTDSLWQLNHTYQFLMPAYVLIGEASEQVLGYDPTRQVFDVIRIEDGSILGQTSQLDLTGCDVKIIGRYHNEARRLAVRSGNTISLYRFGTPLATDEPPESSPSTFRLLPCYPNPFNPSTQISFDLPRPSHVSLRVFDVTGRLVSTFSDGLLSAGSHTITLDGHAFPSGIYFCRVDAGTFSATQKLILLK